MNHREIVERIVETLRDVLRETGHGAIKNTEDYLGVGSGYLRWARARGVLRLGHLAKILEFLGMSPGLFFRRAFPLREDDAITELLLEAREIAGRVGEPQTVAELRRERLRRPGKWVERVEQPVADEMIDPAQAQELEHLDDLRYDGARQALDVARRAERLVRAHRDRPALVVRSLGVWASALRILTRLDEATVVLAPAIEIARHHGLNQILGDLLQRASFIVFDRGELDRALALNNAALVLHLEYGNSPAVARALIDRGSLYNSTGRSESAIRAYTLGKRQLPADGASRHLAAALQGLACAYHQTGRLEHADRFAARAAAIISSSAFLAGRLSWIQARIAVDREDFECATRLYDETLEAFRDQPYDAVVIAAEWVRVLLLQGRRRTAAQWARKLTWLERALESNKIVHAALTDMIRLAWVDQLELRVVEKIIQRIERGCGYAQTHTRTLMGS